MKTLLRLRVCFSFGLQYISDVRLGRYYCWFHIGPVVVKSPKRRLYILLT